MLIEAVILKLWTRFDSGLLPLGSVGSPCISAEDPGVVGWDMERASRFQRAAFPCLFGSEGPQSRQYNEIHPKGPY